MLWSEIIKDLLLALTAYFNLKAKTCCIDLHERSYDKQNEIINEINKLSNHPDPADVDRIAVLQLQLQQERQRLADVSAYCIKSKPQTKDSNM